MSINTKLNPKPDNQVGGDHYSRLTIEPIQFIEANGLNYCEANAVKYISRWRNKNGVEDLNKAKWYIERLIQVEEERVAQELRDERHRAVENHCPEPCQDCDCGVTTQEEADSYIMDLQFYGWSEMSSDARLEIQCEARRQGKHALDVLRDMAESCSDDEARLIWTNQDGEEKA